MNPTQGVEWPSWARVSIEGELICEVDTDPHGTLGSFSVLPGCAVPSDDGRWVPNLTRAVLRHAAAFAPYLDDKAAAATVGPRVERV